MFAACPIGRRVSSFWTPKKGRGPFEFEWSLIRAIDTASASTAVPHLASLYHLVVMAAKAGTKCDIRSLDPCPSAICCQLRLGDWHIIYLHCLLCVRLFAIHSCVIFFCRVCLLVVPPPLTAPRDDSARRPAISIGWRMAMFVFKLTLVRET